MRNGLLPSNVYDRAVYKPVYKYNKDRGAVCMTDGASVCFIPDSAAVCVSSEFGVGDTALAEKLNSCMLRLESSCIVRRTRQPEAVAVDLTLPASAEEGDLREIISELINACGAWDVSLARVCVRSSDHVSYVQIYLSTCPSPDADIKAGPGTCSVTGDKSFPEKQIVMTGLAGACAGRIIASGFPGRLKDRFTDSYIERIRNMTLPGIDQMNGIRDALHSCSSGTGTGVTYIHPVGEGGLYSALWDMSVDNRCGFEVNLKSIPVAQETIELCNHLDLDPYMMCSDGCLLMITDDPARLIEELGARNIDSAHIGCLTSDLTRAIINRDEIRHLNRPEPDELIRAEHMLS